MSEELKKDNQETVETGSDEKKGRFYTDEEIAMLEQKAGDKRVSQFQKTLDKRQREANKLKNMTDTEKFEYELSQKEQELEERENKLVLAENKSACIAILVDKGLDAGLADFVVDVDAEVMDAKIKALDKAFKASVKKEVEKRLSSKTPKMNLPDKDNMTKADLSKMTVRELQIFKNTQPQMYAELMGK